MSSLVVFAALASIVITAMLTFVLWRMNAPRKRARDGDASDGGASWSGAPARRAHEHDDSGADSGGGDGGGGGD
ncbi:MAG TPA: hypothetical protein PLK37_03975 [Terricaulis sp.]|nr:hypothetical protein [Terricaulis sp.]